MPEGDTLYKAAARLQPLVGQVVTRFESSVLDVDTVGRVVSKIEARGKNLLVWFDDAHAVYTHLRMEGSWHLYAADSAWRKPNSRARVVVGTEQWVAVCFNAPVVEWLSAWEVKHHRVLAQLGPDLLAEDEPIAAAIQRLRVNPERPLGEAILDQRLVAGLGNVYKSELLFLERLDPFKSVGSYDDATLTRLLAAGMKWMRRNVGDGPRRTRWDLGRARAWVYNRSGELCPRCNAPIQMRRQGAMGRSTYYCPQCQGVGEIPGAEAPVLRPRVGGAVGQSHDSEPPKPVAVKPGARKGRVMVRGAAG